MTIQSKSFTTPDESRAFTNGEMAVLDVGGMIVGRGAMQPGWRWSQDVKPLAGTDSCEIPHTGYVISGRVHVKMDDGTERELGPGDVYVIPSGHDAWVVGDETYTAVEWSGTAGEFAKGS